MKSYRQLLKNAIILTWQKKALWIFGFFAAIISSQTALDIFNRTIFSINNAAQNNIFNKSKIFFSAIQKVIQDAKIVIAHDPGYFAKLLSVFLVFIIFSIILIWIAFVCETALFYSIFKIFKKEKTSFKESIKFGFKKFWPVFTINVITFIIFWTTLQLISLPFTLIADNAFQTISTILLSIISYIIITIIFFVTLIMNIFSIMYIAKDNNKMIESIRKAFALMKKNWIICIETAVVLFLARIASIILALTALMIIGLPLYILLYIILGAGMLNLAQMLAYVFLTILIIFIFFYATLITTFEFIFWSQIFMKIHDQKFIGKMKRVIHKLK